MAFKGAVELKYHLLQEELVGEGRTTRKIRGILKCQNFLSVRPLYLKSISPHITGELYPNRFVLKEFNLEIASERHLWAIWVISAIIRM